MTARRFTSLPGPFLGLILLTSPWVAVPRCCAEDDPGSPLKAAAEIVIAGAVAGDAAVDVVADQIQEAKPTLLQICAQLGGDWFAGLVDKPVNQQSPVDRAVMGTRARGTARTSGRVTMQQLDAESTDKRVVFLLTLTGRTVSHTRSTQGPVQVHSESTMPFTCHVRVAFDGMRFTAEPASYDGTVQLRTRGVRVNARVGRRLIRRVAWRKIDESRPCAEQLALTQTRDRVTSSFDQCVADHLGRLNQRVADIDLGEMFRRAVGPPPAPVDELASATDKAPGPAAVRDR